MTSDIGATVQGSTVAALMGVISCVTVRSMDPAIFVASSKRSIVEHFRLRENRLNGSYQLWAT
jgi:hypothetical protein